MSQKPRQRPTVLDFAVVKANQILFHQQVSNDKKAIAAFLKYLRQQTKATIAECLFCMEHTGIVRHEVARFEYG